MKVTMMIDYKFDDLRIMKKVIESELSNATHAVLDPRHPMAESIFELFNAEGIVVAFNHSTKYETLLKQMLDTDMLVLIPNMDDKTEYIERAFEAAMEQDVTICKVNN